MNHFSLQPQGVIHELCKAKLVKQYKKRNVNDINENRALYSNYRTNKGF